MDEATPFKGLLTLLLLHEISKKPSSGQELAERMGKRRGKPLTPGTIYPTLKRMKKRKLVVMKRNGRSKIYTLTEGGAERLQLLKKAMKRYFRGIR